MVEPLEDFAEMLSGYVTKSQSEWNAILADAGTTGAASISAKLDIVRNYMQESWNVDIDQLRAAVLRRASTLSAVDLEHLN